MSAHALHNVGPTAETDKLPEGRWVRGNDQGVLTVEIT